MAIQVGGTTVINNSRKLQNVTGLKTINGSSLLGTSDISISSGPGLGVTKTSIGSATGANSGGATVSCAAGKWYTVVCSSDNQGGPISANAGTGAITVLVSGTTSPTINTLGLTQGSGRLFYAESTTTVDITSNRGRVYVHRVD